MVCGTVDNVPIFWQEYNREGIVLFGVQSFFVKKKFTRITKEVDMYQLYFCSFTTKGA